MLGNLLLTAALWMAAADVAHGVTRDVWVAAVPMVFDQVPWGRDPISGTTVPSTASRASKRAPLIASRPLGTRFQVTGSAATHTWRTAAGAGGARSRAAAPARRAAPTPARVTGP